jgi:hypothetical protein
MYSCLIGVLGKKEVYTLCKIIVSLLSKLRTLTMVVIIQDLCRMSM